LFKQEDFSYVIESGKNVSYDLKKKVIVLTGDITHITAFVFQNIFLAFEKNTTPKPVIVILNSKGGDTYACIKMYHRMRAFRSNVYTVAHKEVHSGALFLFQAGTKRFITRESE